MCILYSSSFNEICLQNSQIKNFQNKNYDLEFHDFLSFDSLTFCLSLSFSANDCTVSLFHWLCSQVITVYGLCLWTLCHVRCYKDKCVDTTTLMLQQTFQCTLQTDLSAFRIGIVQGYSIKAPRGPMGTAVSTFSSRQSLDNPRQLCSFVTCFINIS